jgi:hypothetical protein
VLANDPDIAGQGCRLIGCLGNVVRIGEALSASAGQRSSHILAEAGQRQIEAGRIQPAEFEAEQFES